MWIFTRDGFVSLAQHPQDPGKLLVRAQTKDEIETVVRLLDDFGSTKHEIEQTGDSLCRFATVAGKDVVARVLARLIGEIDYTSFNQSARFDFGADPNFFLFVNPAGLQIARVRPE